MDASSTVVLTTAPEKKRLLSGCVCGRCPERRVEQPSGRAQHRPSRVGSDAAERAAQRLAGVALLLLVFNDSLAIYITYALLGSWNVLQRGFIECLALGSPVAGHFHAPATGRGHAVVSGPLSLTCGDGGTQVQYHHTTRNG